MWRTVSTRSLLPGDIVSIAHSKASKEQVIPCDLLLLHGSCIVNESSLTGESVPQRKDALSELLSSEETNNSKKSKNKETGDKKTMVSSNTEASCGFGDEFLCLGTNENAAKRHRKFIVFGGTQVLQHEERHEQRKKLKHHTGGSAGQGQDSDMSVSIPRSPDEGCTCLVLRTGFESSQGNMMRIVLFASERITANSNEAAMFIGVLLVVAIVAAWYVLSSGLQDERRNRFKLYLHCVMIITSVYTTLSLLPSLSPHSSIFSSLVSSSVLSPFISLIFFFSSLSYPYPPPPPSSILNQSTLSSTTGGAP